MRLGKTKRFPNPSKHLTGMLAMGLAIGVLVTLLLFIRAYQKLNASILNERVEAVQQLGFLLSDKVAMLKDAYADETRQLAFMLENSQVTSREEMRRMFSGSGDILLVTAAGNLQAMDGRMWIIKDDDLRINVSQGTNVESSFATIQTQGDFWLFSLGLKGVTLDGEEIAGLVKPVNAQEYADIATIPLYNGMGASYVIDSDGRIVMRPNATEANDLFNGYNLYSIMAKEGVSLTELEQLKTAVAQGQSFQFVTFMRDMTWLIQSVSTDANRGIIIAVPISVTAKDTYGQMRSVIFLITLVVLFLAALVLSALVLMIKRNQAVSLEQAKARAKNDFLDKMSHDIRTPLNAIIGMHELALGSPDDPGLVTDCLKKAKMSSEYLVSVINDVLDMSKIESGKMTVSNRQFNMEELLDHVMQMEENPAREKRLSLFLDLESPIDTDFIGDPLRIRQCLINLVSNSIKFTPESGEIHLSYRVEPIDETYCQVRFKVRDTGIGMSEDFLERIFTPFEQEYSSLTSSYVGSGLGLSIVNSLVSLMNGTIFVESDLGHGSCFTISLPLPMAPKSAASRPVMDEEGLVEQLKDRRVLVAEDNDINREIISLMLEKLGLAVDTAVNGRDVLNKFTQSSPDSYSMILMDIQMPVMDGLEAARQIRASARPDRRIPIVALSANAFDEDTQRSLDAGMQAHLAKPVDIIELKRILKLYIK
ncbi:ATP-binding protein [Enterocloster citroniae]|uniref:Circadian input-output histidine kinase CikA n=3 Tax=Enterocloster citroniae TaxID=358743 RepID=A0AA41FKJ5_9FIRM|nr:ATP-binding protein [Enterocloster citroniae]MBT9813329.1 response regulator [Enterocloster citroniae]MCB7066897.1 response regulator [Enterocloster citroniae]RGC09904.1 response regulator [Enterocloster citroniae]